MITKFNSFLNESKHTDEYTKTLSVINQLVDNGDILLKDKTPKEITDIIVGKNKKYSQIGFESFFINMADGNGFVSEGDKERMGEYINKIKEMGIDIPKLEKIYDDFKILNKKLKDIDNLEQNLRSMDKDDEEYDDLKEELEKLYNDVEKYDKVLNDLKNELKKISKKVIKKL
jgi:DNA repair ATPase RecN